MSIAFGGEHRTEESEGTVSALDQASAFFAGNAKATIGKFNVNEAFLETVVPLLSSTMAGARDLGLQRRGSLHGPQRHG